MNWRAFLPLQGEPVPRTIHIEVREFGIPKVVFVRTKRNGGIRVKNIPVKA